MVQQIRKRVEFSSLLTAEGMALLAKQVSELARDLLKRAEANVALDGTNGPLVGTLDAGLHEIRNARTLTFGSTPTNARTSAAGLLSVDWEAGQIAETTLTANATGVQLVDPPGTGRFVLHVLQDSVGGRTIGGWDARIKWIGGAVPVITAAPNALDKIAFDFDGSVYLGEVTQAYA